MYQDEAFATLVARHSRARVLDLSGVLAIAQRLPGLGYGPVYVACPDLKAPFQAWWPRALRIRCSEITIHTARAIPEFARWESSTDDTYSFVVDLGRGEEELWRRLEPRCRKAVRSGRKRGLTVREARGEEDVRPAYEGFARASGGGRHFDLPGYALVQAVARSRHGKLFVATRGERIVGALLLLVGEQLYGWLAAFERDPGTPVPSNLMYWEVIRWGAAAGYRYLDLGQQSLAAPGLTLFKRSFAPDLFRAYSYRIVRSRARSAAARVVESARRRLAATRKLAPGS